MAQGLEAALCLWALITLRRLGLRVPFSFSEVTRRLGVARSVAYEQLVKLRALIEREDVRARAEASPAHPDVRLRIENAVLRYRVEHPGSWLSGGRTVYSEDLRAFVLALAQREGVGERLTQEEFAAACGIPLATVKPWWAAQRTSAAPAVSAAPPAAGEPPSVAATPAAAEAPRPASGPGVPPGEAPPSSAPAGAATAAEGAAGAGSMAETIACAPAAQPAAAEPAPAQAPQPAAPEAAASADDAAAGTGSTADATSTASPTAGFTLQMQRIIAAWDGWSGSFDAFVRQHLPTLGLHYGKETVSQLLHLAAARKLSRRAPPAPSTRGSTFIPPPGVQWSSDGKEVVVVVGGEPFTVAWQPVVDVGSAATVGSTIRPAEDAAGVISSFNEGVATTGAAPAALLLDNKAPNKSAELEAALPAATFLMYGTPGRGQSKATIEGGFGLFAQDLGPVAAVVDIANPGTIALTVAEAVTRAYAAGRNHRPRRKDGKTPYELYRDRDQSPDVIDAAVAVLRKIKERIEARLAREAASRDPYVRATLEDACVRFGFEQEGDLPASLAKLPLATVQKAIAIYASKQRAQSLPADAGLRYFAGIARQCQYERELQFFEEELVSQLVREEPLVHAHLESRAAALAPLEHAPRLAAIVHEILATAAPVARVFWRRRLETEAASTAPQLRAPLRRWLCERVRRFFRATKQARQQLVELLVRLFPDPSPSPAAV
jgi:hypothetical protein